MAAKEKLEALASRLQMQPRDTLALLKVLASDLEEPDGGTDLAEDLVEAASEIEEYLGADDLKAYFDQQMQSMADQSD